MQRNYLQTIGTPIITSLGQQTGRVIDILLNPDDGKIVAFILSPDLKKIVSPIDVTKWGMTIIIHDLHDVVASEEILKVTKILEANIKILKNNVVTKSGENLGRVIDYRMDCTHFCLTGIVVAKQILGIIQWDKRIINFKDIIEITKDKIIVKDSLEDIPIKKTVVDMAPTM